jgi:hypothetical protein
MPSWTISFDRAAYSAEDDPVVLVLVEAVVETAASPQAPERRRTGAGVELTLALDTSGSMDAADRYPLLRRAVAALLGDLGPRDSVAVVVFSDGADVVLPVTAGDVAGRSVGAILERMDESSCKFGGATCLAPALDWVVALAGHAGDDRPRRTLILTDGEIHDMSACTTALGRLRGCGHEVGAYGFGAAFDARSLRGMLSDQIGGWVKPICRTEDLVATFGHVAAASGRVVGHGAQLSVELDEGVDVGDAWAFRPQERYLGPIEGRRVVRELGALEAGRTYSLLLEVRIPPHDAPRTHIGAATLAWQSGGPPFAASVVPLGASPACRARSELARDDRLRQRQRESSSAAIEVPRTAAREPGATQAHVATAAAVLEALRRPHEQLAIVRAAHARLELALLEQRDPGLVAALRKHIDVIEGRSPSDVLGDADRQYIDADPCTMVGPAAIAEAP